MTSTAKPTAPQPFGDWLLDMLHRKDWSQRRLAREAGVTSAAVSRWVRGMDLPGAENIARIAAAFGLDPVVVMHRVNGSPPTLGYLAALEDDLTEEEMASVAAFAEYVKARRGRQN